jgi:uncharacterized protein YecT (DUF1311 family)
MKIKLFISTMILIFSASSHAGSIIENGPGVKKYFDSNPHFSSAAVRLTDMNTWAQCTNVYLSMMAMEVRGKKWDDQTALIFTGLGEAMSRVRLNLLSKGYKDENLGSLLKTYSTRPVDVPDMQFCNAHINKILDTPAPASAPAPAPAPAPKPATPSTPTPSASSKAPISDSSPFAPSFDCSKASNAQEKMICADRELSSLDVSLSQAYKRARDKSTDKDLIKKQQLNWIKSSVRTCADKSCLVDVYKKRITELQ